MSKLIRRLMPLSALCLAVFLGGCVVVPERRAYGPAVYVPGPVGWGWHR